MDTANEIPSYLFDWGKWSARRKPSRETVAALKLKLDANNVWTILTQLSNREATLDAGPNRPARTLSPVNRPSDFSAINGPV